MKKIVPALAVIACLAAFTVGGSDAGQERTDVTGTPSYLLFLVPQGFHGWACVDFGTVGAPPLSREQDAWVVPIHPGEVVRTSSECGGFPPSAEAQAEVAGRHVPLSEDIYPRQQVYGRVGKIKVQRYCTFIGTMDEADAAGDAPGFEGGSKVAQGLSQEEREALVALYKATDGDHWKHRFGWLGPPGTECTWHGVECLPATHGRAMLWGLELSENNLRGSIPESLSRLNHLDFLSLFGNHLTGMLPRLVIERWLSGSFDVAAEDKLLTDVSEISLETSAPAVLCGWNKVTLRSDRSVTQMTKRCRNATPNDRTTFCEVKEGDLGPREFARLAWLLEKKGFYAFQPEYTRSMTHGVFETTRVTRNGKHYEVSNYANAGPFELWSIQAAIEGVAASAEWGKTSTQPECSSRAPGGAAPRLLPNSRAP